MLLAKGELCVVVRGWDEESQARELFSLIKSYALFWPRHLGFENFTIVFDAENVLSHIEAAAIEAMFDFVRVRYDAIPTNIEYDVVFPAVIGPRRSGWDRQAYSTLYLDTYCDGAGVIVVFDSDAPLVTPVTFSDLFDGHGRIGKVSWEAPGGFGNSKATRLFLGANNVTAFPEVRQKPPRYGGPGS